MIKGQIVEWFDAKGYGFIKSTHSEQKVFVHISALNNRDRRPKMGDEVKFEVLKDNRGRYNANNVTRIGDAPMTSSMVFSTIYLFAAIIATMLFNGEKWIILGYALMSLVTYFMYAIDKNAAKEGRWRTSENTLHLLALFGGWPGALCAQSEFNHKSKKQPFKTILWITVIANIAAFVWTFTPSGHTATHELIHGIISFLM
ncbi:DUF1294 domain-containing protein [Vibrio ezurae]|uniref:CSD domain-containing protein n=1 Tax=Vibrio ezurae NBRC 102218 TaxID=1219080 RepID=U3B0H7_9VIBR|nr:cold shock and DUF1294 domain-containing protein [Vibrio ezurae]GAD79485.1 hypothetical protein VEZ01S_16_00340 [Vibrio ezurae NBRC 102218]